MTARPPGGTDPRMPGKGNVRELLEALEDRTLHPRAARSARSQSNGVRQKQLVTGIDGLDVICKTTHLAAR